MNPAGTAAEPTERLLRRTQLRLATVTLALVTALVILVGATTAWTATALMRQAIDRALDDAVRDSLVLHDMFEDESEHASADPLGEADTFVLVVTADGQVVTSTTDADLSGLPDLSALDAAANGTDLRDGRYGGTAIRLLTTRLPNAAVEDEEGQRQGPLFAQAGFNLTLQNRLEQQLVLGIGLVGLLGIVGSLIVTFFITRRALVPIREAFATERRFVAAASHELQTPVSIIRASAEILDREALVQDDAADLVADIVAETDRLGRLVADLLALSSLEAGAIALEIREVELGTWFGDVSRRARAVTETRGLRLATQSIPGADSCAIQTDRERLDQIVLILIDNAAKHSPPQGEVALELSLDVRAERALVAVRDHGPGIPAEEQERIFEPFARVPGGRGGAKGFGLGLAIAKQLAGRLGAGLSVTSTPGSGATFQISLRVTPLPSVPRSGAP